VYASDMNHAIVPKFANPHFFSQRYERTSRAEHTKHTEILPDNTQDDIDTLKRKLDELLHESWTDVLQSAQPVRDAEHSQVSGKRCKTAVCDLGASEDESVCKYVEIHGSATRSNRFFHFSISSFVEHEQPSAHIFTTEAATSCSVCCHDFPITVIGDSDFVSLTPSTREPEWEDSLSEAKERRRRARSVAVEFGSQWCTWDSPQRQANAKVNLFPICVCYVMPTIYASLQGFCDWRWFPSPPSLHRGDGGKQSSHVCARDPGFSSESCKRVTGCTVSSRTQSYLCTSYCCSNDCNCGSQFEAPP